MWSNPNRYFFRSFIPQKPAVSQPQSTWVQQFCLIFQFLEFVTNRRMFLVCLWGAGAMAVPAAALPCPVAPPELFPCVAQGMSDVLPAGAPKPGLLSLLCSRSWFHETESRPNKCLAQFPAWLPSLFLQRERPSEQHLIQVISAPGSVIPAKLSLALQKCVALCQP